MERYNFQKIEKKWREKKFAVSVENKESNKNLMERNIVIQNSKQGLTPFAAYELSGPGQLDNIIFLLSTGNITSYSGDCIVNTTNNKNQSAGAGVDGNVGRKGGEALRKARSKHNHIDTGKAVITIGGDLPCKYCVHAVGPAYYSNKNDTKADKLLHQVYASALHEAITKKHEIKTIITRIGEGTKIILTGDVEQIDETIGEFFAKALLAF